jgi:hypothetical protein
VEKIARRLEKDGVRILCQASSFHLDTMRQPVYSNNPEARPSCA